MSTEPVQPPAKRPASGLSVAYAIMYPGLVSAARDCGYALGIHGTMGRDFDLIAVPWTSGATDALTLILALKAATETNIHHFDFDHHWPDCAPTVKPHGRVAYSLHFTNRGGDGPYIDVSVMPRVPVESMEAAI